LNDTKNNRLNDSATNCWSMRSPSAGQVEEPFSARFRPGRSGRQNPDAAVLIEGLRMSQHTGREFEHRPVMVDEIVAWLEPVPPGVSVDATVGGGGHAAAILTAYPHLSLVGFDQDGVALEAAARALAGFGDRVIALHHARFDRLAELVTSPVSAVVFDLGISSPQIDWPERGFSYMGDGPLDMRMDQRQALTAAAVVNSYTEAKLASLFADSGDRRLARRIAAAVVAARPLETTSQLANVVAAAVPAPARRRGHPAKRVFQALRIEVNRELDVLPAAVDAAIDLLAPGGRCIVLAYHSGEDRLVKDRFLNAATGGCTCPPNLPCVCGATPTVKLLTRGARKAGAAEIAANRRAESARLRGVEKLA
jgi:16S rRNA (cytosine1402-N4)-methyltransferase